ncbi:hypothetical protein [Candidatus Protochlamydia phocaeensis]|uniref:hypothetical protein n=1 Tax=Candidatus Protochlamydia phocaeensis TaxID=1414722 RepID=UPI000837C61A|nr:hypothetical protein [Candidatus Protochlamydia phocaeensis]
MNLNLNEYRANSYHSVLHQIKNKYVANYQGELIKKTTVQGWIIHQIDRSFKLLGLSRWKVFDGSARMRQVVHNILERRGNESNPERLAESNPVLLQLKNELWEIQELKDASRYLCENIFNDEQLFQEIDKALKIGNRHLAFAKMDELIQKAIIEKFFPKDLERAYGSDVSPEERARLFTEQKKKRDEACDLLKIVFSQNENQLKENGISPLVFKKLVISCFKGMDHAENGPRRRIRAKSDEDFFENGPKMGNSIFQRDLSPFVYFLDEARNHRWDFASSILNPYRKKMEKKPDVFTDSSITPYALDCLLTHFLKVDYQSTGLILDRFSIEDAHAFPIASFISKLAQTPSHLRRLNQIILSDNAMTTEGLRVIANSLLMNSQSIEGGGAALPSLSLINMKQLDAQALALVDQLKQAGINIAVHGQEKTEQS